MKKDLLAKRQLLIFIGAVWLFNPVVNIVDVIPDGVGWLMIWLGLAPFAIADDEFIDTRRYALMLTVIGAVKLALTPAVAFAAYEDDRLLATTCFAVAECIFTTLFCNSFFKEVSYVADRNNGSATAAICDDTAIYVKIFLQLRIWLPLLPELTALAGDEAVADEGRAEDWLTVANMKNVIILFVVLVMLVLGIIFIIRVSRLYKAVRSDTEMHSALTQKYTEAMASDTAYAFRGKLRVATAIAALGSCCFISLYISGIPIAIPAYGFVLIGLYGTLAGEVKNFETSLKLGVVCFVCDGATEIISRTIINQDMVAAVQMTLYDISCGLCTSLLSIAAWLAFGYAFFKDMAVYAQMRRFDLPGSFALKAVFALMLILRTESMLLPFLRLWLKTPYFIVSVIFAILFIKYIYNIYATICAHTRRSDWQQIKAKEE